MPTTLTRQTQLSRTRARARLLARGVTVTAVAELAGVSLSLASHVLAGQRSAASPLGMRVADAAETLSGLAWADLIAPPRARRAA